MAQFTYLCVYVISFPEKFASDNETVLLLASALKTTEVLFWAYFLILAFVSKTTEGFVFGIFLLISLCVEDDRGLCFWHISYSSSY